MVGEFLVKLDVGIYYQQGRGDIYYESSWRSIYYLEGGHLPLPSL